MLFDGDFFETPDTYMLRNAQLVIPKHHGAKLTDIPDDALTEILVRSSLLYR